MRLTTKGRYAVTALLDLANQGEKAVVPLSDISERQNISISYLEQLFSKLRKQGLVMSIRGASGGYKIAQPMDSISVLDIIDAVDESVNATRCEGKANCQGGGQCLTHDLWTGLTAHIADYLSNVKLSALLSSDDCQPVTMQLSQAQAKKSQARNKTQKHSSLTNAPVYSKQTPERAAVSVT